MWILLNDSALSIVDHLEKPGHLLVRSRIEGDIERAIPRAVVYEDASADYRYRANVPREVVKQAISVNATGVIFAHNHPSGEPRPSPEDVAITRQLVFAGRLMGITVHEHLIIGEKGHYSFADEGHMARLNSDFETGTGGRIGEPPKDLMPSEPWPI